MSSDAASEINVRAPRFAVTRATARCAHCGASSHVVAIALPQDHETRDPEIDGDQAWQPVNGFALVFYVAHLPGAVRARLPGAATYRLAESAATASCYWANHCESCGAMFEDHDLHCEPGGAFSPTCAADATAIGFEPIGDHFEALIAGYTLEPEFLAGHKAC